MKVNTAGLFSLEHAAPTQAVDDEPPPPPPVRADGPTEVAPRVRKTTLDNFNEEMSVLDRPLDEVEVEFYDEPKPRRWRVPAIGAAIFALSCGAYLGVLRHRRTAEATSAATVPAPAATPVVASAPPVPSAATTAATVPPAAAATAATAPASSVADGSGARAHHHHHARHGGQHHHHGGHGHYARG
ncbi:MAG TPA: hypothetical protein VI456_10250 [Polyangia bacterium]